MGRGGGGVGLASFAVAVCGYEGELKRERVGLDGIGDGGAGAVAVNRSGHWGGGRAVMGQVCDAGRSLGEMKILFLLSGFSFWNL